MGVLLHLAAAHGHQAIPVLLGQQLPHLLAAAGIEALTDDQEGVILQIRGYAIEGGGGRLVAEGRAYGGGIGGWGVVVAGGVLFSACVGGPVASAHRPRSGMEFGGQLR